MHKVKIYNNRNEICMTIVNINVIYVNMEKIQLDKTK